MPTIGGVLIRVRALEVDLPEFISILGCVLIVDLPEAEGGLEDPMALIPAGVEGGLSLLARAFADRAGLSAGEGCPADQWISDFLAHHAHNRDNQRACSSAIAELKARGVWPWPGSG
jgi:hypothetical protein